MFSLRYDKSPGIRRAALCILAAAAAAFAPRPGHDLLRSTGGIPASIAGSFRQPLAYQQTDDGRSFVFDRRSHAVYTIADGTARKVIEVGAEPGRVIDPTAFAIDPADGTFVIADAPMRQQRIQVFTAAGSRVAGFTLQTREVARVTLDTVVLNGVGSIQFTGRSIFINQPETGALISELSLYGQPIRAFGELRKAGPDALRRVELLRLVFHDELKIREIAVRWEADAAKLHHQLAKGKKEFKKALLEVVGLHYPGTLAEVEQKCFDLLDLLA